MRDPCVHEFHFIVFLNEFFKFIHVLTLKTLRNGKQKIVVVVKRYRKIVILPP